MRYEIRPYDACSFCQDLTGQRESAFVVRNNEAAVILNERQYEKGAMLVIPLSHRESVLDMTDGEIGAVYRLARDAARAATMAFGALGVNIFQNNGLRAGQSEPHFHVHVVPRFRDSDPDRRFSREDSSAIPIEEQRAIAAAIAAALEKSREAR